MGPKREEINDADRTLPTDDVLRLCRAYAEFVYSGVSLCVTPLTALHCDAPCGLKQAPLTGKNATRYNNTTKPLGLMTTTHSMHLAILYLMPDSLPLLTFVCGVSVVSVFSLSSRSSDSFKWTESARVQKGRKELIYESDREFAGKGRECDQED